MQGALSGCGGGLMIEGWRVREDKINVCVCLFFSLTQATERKTEIFCLCKIYFRTFNFMFIAHYTTLASVQS